MTDDDKRTLEQILANPKDFVAITNRLAVFASNWVYKDRVPDLVQQSCLAAIVRERKGDKPYLPGGAITPLRHMIAVLLGELANDRKKRKRKPETQHEEDKHAEPASDEASVLEMLIEHQEEDVRAQIAKAADEALKQLAAETKAHLTLRLLEAWRNDIHGHDELAKHLGCTVPEVRAAMKRLARRAEKVREILKSTGASP